MKSFDPSKFTTTKAKWLPVYLLLDTSDSMSGEKITALNQAVEEMFKIFAQEKLIEIEIVVAVITFGETASLHQPPTRASNVVWADLVTRGRTPLGAAMRIAKDMVEDKTRTPSRAYRPTIVLVSDGQPNDEWEGPLDAFIGGGRSAKCDRMAMAIGADADEDVLKRFISGTPHQIFYAENASDIHKFFQLLTMSVTTRAHSKNPNEIPTDDDIKLDGSSVPSDVESDDSGPSNPAAGSEDNSNESYY